MYYLQSRYYDPAIGRFINADSYASTGQGIIGCNMYAYCGNNPLTYWDDAGNAPKKSADASQLDGNATVFIVNQRNEPYGEMDMGITNVAHGGCAPIASYNVMKMMGREVTLEEIITYYEENNLLYLGGIAGSSPYSCAKYLRSEGYTVALTKDVNAYADLAETADAAILWYWFDSDAFPGVGAHFVAFHQRNGIGTYYNVFSNSKSFYTCYGGVDEFLSNTDGCCPVLMLIYD